MRKSFASPTLDGLLDLACRDGVDIRPTLLRVATDLYVQKPAHSADEEVQYVELALGLIDAVDAPTREAVAARLAAYASAPAAVLRRLGRDVPEREAPPADESSLETELTELFFAASAEERRLILTNFDAVADGASHRPPTSAGEAIVRLERAALDRNATEFARILERALGVGAAVAECIARDPSGEPIVVAARALGMKAAVLQRILLFLNPEVGQSVQRVYDLARLYDEMTPAAAQSMVAIWRQMGGPKRRPRHEPLHWDDMHRSARAQASHGGHRIARSREPLPSRRRRLYDR